MSDYPRFYPDQVVPPERFGDRTDQLRQIEYTLQAIREGRPLSKTTGFELWGGKGRVTALLGRRLVA